MGEAGIELEGSLIVVVFFNITWNKGDFGPTVVARWIDKRRATDPAHLVDESHLRCNSYGTYLAFQRLFQGFLCPSSKSCKTMALLLRGFH
jgi:hypothetical protein